ncbi:MAG: cystathionine beta-lyase [Betaproteobacteria bacterium]|nr:cystathionine beta-lyase [Betaproteobacteria bacterium]
MDKQAPTALIHHSYVPPEGFEATQPGIFKASSVFFPNVAAMRSREWKDKTAYTYGLHGTPSSYTLEERLCTLEGGLQCVLAPSGLAALALVSLALLRSGDEVLLPDNVYEPNKSLAEAELRNWGISHRFYNPMDLADLEAKLSDKTRLVWLEAAGSVTLEFPDLVGMVRVCKARGVCTALDNTWGAGIAFQPFDLVPGSETPLGVDISAQALTKYPSGGGDVLMGSVITRDPALHMRIKLTHMRLGLNVGSNDVELVLRALPSIYLRYRAHDASTRALATWCQEQPEFAQVLHPALSGSPGHAHWRGLCTSDAAACLFSVVLDARFSQPQVDAFVDALRLFRLAYSWAGPVSLVVPYDLARSRGRWPTQVAKGTVVRFAVGLEGTEDLRADIAQALAVLRA